MDYVALYRKWRPQDFSSLIGQEHIKTALSNALLQNRIAHAYLFCGPRGTGKTSTAKILAKAVNCEKGPTPEPCNECLNCERVNKGSSMDVFEIDGASNRGIGEIRELRENIRFSPVEGRKRIYIIDEVHSLTPDAFNGLLKTLEEPPEHVIFILATTEPHKIPATILSRCQRYDFRRLGIEDTTQRLADVATNSGMDVSAGALRLIATQADGGMRDALSLLDQCSVMAQGRIDEETVRSLLGIVGKDVLRELLWAIGAKDEKRVLKFVDELLLGGKDIKQLLGEISSYLRAVLLFKTSPDFPDVYITDSEENLAKIAEIFDVAQLIAAAKKLHTATNELRFAIQPRITMEICLLELCNISQVDQEMLIERIVALEEKLKVAEGSVLRKTATDGSFEKTDGKTIEVAAIKSVTTEKNIIKATEKIDEVELVKTPVAGQKMLGGDEQEKEQRKEPVTQVISEKFSKDIETDDIKLDLNDIWERMLQNLLSQNKRSVHALVCTGKLVALGKGKALLEFEREFACKRMYDKDYKEAVEKELALLTGQEVRIDCCSGDKEKSGQEAPRDSKKSRGKPDAAQYPEVVRAALEIFDGVVYKIKK